MRLTRLRLLLIVLIVIGASGLAAWRFLQSELFWRWSGRQLVALVQERVAGELTVEAIEGTPLTGLAFVKVRLTTPQGEVFTAPRLEMRLSLWSLVRLQPVVARLTLVRPHLTLRRDGAGAWEILSLLKTGGGGGPPVSFRELTLSQVVVQAGEVTLSGPAKTLRLTEVTLDGALNVLHPFTPPQTLQVRRAALAAVTPWGKLGLSGRLAYSQGLLNLLSLAASVDDRPLVSLAGEVRLGDGEPAVRLAGEAGPSPAALLRRLWPRWPEVWEPCGKWRLEGTMARVQVEFSGLLETDSAIDLKGSLGWAPPGFAYDLALTAGGLHPARAAAVAGLFREIPPNAPRLGLRLQARGGGFPWTPERLAWSLDVDPAAWGPTRLEALRLELTGNGRQQRLEGRAKGNFGQLQVNATGPLHLGQGEVGLKAEAFHPALLGWAPGAGVNLSGSFKGSFRLPSWRQPERVRLSGEAEVRGRAQQHEVKEARARLTWERPKLDVAQGRVALSDLTLDLAGSVDGERLNFTYKGRFQPGGPLLPGSLKGRLDGEGKLTGTLSAPDYTAQGRGEGLAGDGWSLGGATFKAAGRGWPPVSGSLELQGSDLRSPAGAFAQVRVQGQGEARRWRFLLTAATPKGAQAELAGSADLGASPRTLNLERLRLRLAQLSLENVGPVPVRFDPGLEVGPAVFQAGGGRVQLSLKTRGEALTGQVQVRQFPAELFWVQGRQLAGRLDCQFTFSGEARQPQVDGAVTLNGGRWGQFAFQHLHTAMQYRAGRLQFSGRLEEKAAGPRLNWEGFVPVRLSFHPLQAATTGDDFQVRLRGDRANLSLLAALSPEIETAQGSLDLEALWQGRLDRPRLTGQLRWGEGTLKLRQGGIPYRVEPGAITLEGDRLTLPRLTLVSGGTAVASGSLTLSGFRPHHLDLKIRLEQFKAAQRGGSEVTADGSATLGGPWGAPVLQGQVTVTQGSFHAGIFAANIHDDIILVRRAATPRPDRAEATAPREPGWLDTLRLDVALDTPGVWVRETKLLVLVAGRLKALKQPGRPAYLAGELKALKGSIELQGRSFKVAEGGIITFPGKPGAMPTLKGKAVHEVGEVTLVMVIGGPANRPEVRLESIPPLPPQDLLAYLLFGRPAQALNREEYLRVGPKAAGIVGGLTAQKLQEFLGKDFPLVGDVKLRAREDTVGVAKPLTRDLTISFERKTNPISQEDVNQMRLEYRLNRYLSIESQLGRRNSGADVIFNLDW